MGLAFADSSFLGCVGFLRRRVSPPSLAVPTIAKDLLLARTDEPRVVRGSNEQCLGTASVHGYYCCCSNSSVNDDDIAVPG